MRKTTITTDKNNFVFPPRKPRSDRGDVVFTSCSRCFPIDTQAMRSKILDLAMRGKLTEQLPEDGSAEELFRQIQAEKQRLIRAGKHKEEKPLPEISDEEVPFPVPPSWRWVYLGELFQHNTGKALNSSNTLGQQLEYITTSNLYWNRFELDGLKTMSFTDSELEKCTVRKGDLLVCEGGDIGRSAIWPYDYEMRIQNHIHRLRQYSKNICTEFYYYLLWFYKQTGRINGIGIGLQGFSAKRVHSLIVPLAPYDEAVRLVEIIKQAFSLLDTIDALQAQYADNLTVLKTKLLEAAIQGKLTDQLPEDGTAEDLYRQIQTQKQALIKAGKIKKEKPLPENTTEEIPFEIPSNWKWVVLGNITSKISSGNTPTGGRNSDVYVPSGFPFFREQNIYDDGIHQAGMVFISESLLATRQNSTVKAKDILLNITGGSIGRCALVPDDFDRGSINQHILIIRAVVPETRHYLHMLICSPYVQSQIKNNAVGDKDGFSAGRCKRLLVPLPPLAEQKRIVQKIDGAMKVFEN